MIGFSLNFNAQCSLPVKVTGAIQQPSSLQQTISGLLDTYLKSSDFVIYISAISTVA